MGLFYIFIISTIFLLAPTTPAAALSVYVSPPPPASTYLFSVPDAALAATRFRIYAIQTPLTLILPPTTLILLCAR